MRDYRAFVRSSDVTRTCDGVILHHDLHPEAGRILDPLIDRAVDPLGFRPTTTGALLGLYARRRCGR